MQIYALMLSSIHKRDYFLHFEDFMYMVTSDVEMELLVFKHILHNAYHTWSCHLSTQMFFVLVFCFHHTWFRVFVDILHVVWYNVQLYVQYFWSGCRCLQRWWISFSWLPLVKENWCLLSYMWWIIGNNELCKWKWIRLPWMGGKGCIWSSLAVQVQP